MVGNDLNTFFWSDIWLNDTPRKHNFLICTAWADFLMPWWMITRWKMSGRWSLEEAWHQQNMMISWLCCPCYNLATWLPWTMSSSGPWRKTNLIQLNLYTPALLIVVLWLEVLIPCRMWKCRSRSRCSCGRLITTDYRQPFPSDRGAGRGAPSVVCAEIQKTPITSSLGVP